MDPQAQRWDKEADVVVVGFGAAGAAAAIEAHEAGADVIMLEKSHQPGGNTVLSGGVVYGADTSVQKARGIEDSSEECLKYARAISGELLEESFSRLIVEKSGEDIEWLIRLGVNFPPHLLRLSGEEAAHEFAAVTPPKRRGHQPVEQTGWGVMKPLVKTIADAGIETMMVTPMKGLILHYETGVVGVKTEKLAIRARRAVVLATGGFVRNEEMLRDYVPKYKGCMKTYALGVTGDGILAGLAIGADVLDMDRLAFIVGVPRSSTASTRSAYEGRIPGIVTARTAPYILVDKRGLRFLDEFRHATTLGSKIYNDLEEQTCFCIFDEGTKQSGKEILYRVSSENLGKEIESGTVKTAPTIRELAQKIDIAPDVLEDTVSIFNQHAERGEDPHFGRTKSLVPVRVSPFYAMEIRPAVATSQGGLRINSRCQVIDRLGKVIPRLYAVGETVGGRVGNRPLGSGHMLMVCLATGRTAGQSAAAETPWNVS